MKAFTEENRRVLDENLRYKPTDKDKWMTFWIFSGLSILIIFMAILSVTMFGVVGLVLFFIVIMLCVVLGIL